MKYDFSKILDRKIGDVLAVEGLGTSPGFAPEPPDKNYDIIPMWIADMNFPTVPTIQSSIIERVNHPHFGYFYVKDEYYNSIIQWHKKRNNVNGLTKENIGYENGVLGGVSSALKILCSKGDKVLIHSPVYVGFKWVLNDNGYHMIYSDLKKDSNGIYRMDYEDMEKKIKENNIHTVVFCSPHNPCGRVWEKEEILKAMEIFEKYKVFIISDEIWSDLTLFGNQHIPTQSVNEYAKNHTIAFYAPSKTFNVSGLIGSYHIIYNKYLKDRLDKESASTHYNAMNLLSMYALIGAYKQEGYDWLDQLKITLGENIKYAITYIKENFKGLEVCCPQGTYMLYVDCTEWCKEHNKTIDDVEKAAWKVGVAIQDGRNFNGQCHLRINLALPMCKVKEAFQRLNEFVFNK